MSQESSRIAASHNAKRASRTRRVVLALGGVACAVALTACTPGPTLSVITGPGGAEARPLSVNDAGIVVGSYRVSQTSRAAYSFDLDTGQASTFPAIPPSASFPSGGEFVEAKDINNNGMIVGNALDPDQPWEMRPVAYDSGTGIYKALNCPQFVDAGKGLVTDDGLVICGGSIYDLATDTATPFASPDGCSQVAAKVSDAGLVVGYCTNSIDPLFDSNGTMFAYQLAGATPTRLGLGSLEGRYAIGFAVDEQGVLSAGVQVDAEGGWLLCSYDLTSTQARCAGTGLAPGVVPIPMARTNDGRGVGFTSPGANGAPYGGFKFIEPVTTGQLPI